MRQAKRKPSCRHVISQRMKIRLSNESESEDEDLGKEGAEVSVATPQEETEAR